MNGKKGKESDGVKKKKKKRRELEIGRGGRGVVHEAGIQVEPLTGEVADQGIIRDQEAKTEDEAGTCLGNNYEHWMDLNLIELLETRSRGCHTRTELTLKRTQYK